MGDPDLELARQVLLSVDRLGRVDRGAALAFVVAQGGLEGARLGRGRLLGGGPGRAPRRALCGGDQAPRSGPSSRSGYRRRTPRGSPPRGSGGSGGGSA